MHVGRKTPQVSGIPRSIIALTVFLTLGMAIFNIPGSSNSRKYEQTVSNLLSIMAGLVAAMSGLYLKPEQRHKNHRNLPAKIDSCK